MYRTHDWTYSSAVSAQPSSSTWRMAALFGLLEETSDDEAGGEAFGRIGPPPWLTLRFSVAPLVLSEGGGDGFDAGVMSRPTALRTAGWDKHVCNPAEDVMDERRYKRGACGAVSMAHRMAIEPSSATTCSHKQQSLGFSRNIGQVTRTMINFPEVERSF